MNETLWSIDKMLEVTLKEPDDFLKVRETLSRIGVSSRKEKKLFQSCHILHKQGKYYIVHFKELFALDGKEHNITENDIGRRNSIACLLKDWGLVGFENNPELKAPLSQIKIIAFKEKSEWILEPKYNIGKKKDENESNESNNIAEVDYSDISDRDMDSPIDSSVEDDDIDIEYKDDEKPYSLRKNRKKNQRYY